MKLLLTSGGIVNPSIEAALVGLLGKPVAESNALLVPTAIYGISFGATQAYKNVIGNPQSPFTDLGWKSVGILELTALPTLQEELWHAWVEAADVLLVHGGDPMYLAYWMHESGLARRLPSALDRLVYVGMSAGSMVTGPKFGGSNYGGLNLPAGDVPGLGLVDFEIFPHLDYPDFPHNTMAHAEAWAAKQPGPSYAIDDQTAIRVVDGAVDVVSEGHWRHFER